MRLTRLEKVVAARCIEYVLADLWPWIHGKTDKEMREEYEAAVSSSKKLREALSK